MKNKKCKVCKAEFTPQRFAQSVCGYNCAINHAKELGWKERKEELKEKTKTLGDYARELQREVNKLARLIDFGQLCISSNKVAKKENGGHFWSSGSNKSITFNLHNIHLQSEYDNTYRHANITGYKEGLIMNYGQIYYDYIESLPYCTQD